MNIKEAEGILKRDKSLAKEMNDFQKLHEEGDPEALKHADAKIKEFAKRVKESNKALKTY